MRSTWLIVATLVALCCAGDEVTQVLAAPAAVNLTTSYLTNPIGIDETPRFAWDIPFSARGDAQTSFRVIVSIAGTSTVVWDSGVVTSSRSSVQYGSVGTAKPLESDTSYTWTVTWSNAGAAATAAEANFDTGLLSQSDWKGKWIGGSGNLMRTEFKVASAPKRVRVFVSGIGYYELYINGKRIGDARLDPGWTTYNVRVLYNAYDVTSHLQVGTNVIGVMLGHGWYGSQATREPNGPLSLMFQLQGTTSDEKSPISVISDPAVWQVGSGPIVYDNIYNGETYNANFEQPGWDTTTFTPVHAWSAAVALKPPGGKLSYQVLPPVRVTHLMPAKTITNPQKNTYVIDFEQNFSGWVRLTIANCSKNENVTLRHAEILNHSNDGMLYTDNLRSAKATDVYICKGSGTEVYEPRFTYHGFRYVEFKASFNYKPNLQTLVGMHAHSDLPQTGAITFGASSDILNKIQHNIDWGQRCNLMSVPTDCDQRDERKGWMGDAFLSAEEALHTFYMPAMYSNFLRLMHDDQSAAGSLSDTVPWTFGGNPADPAWGTAYPAITYWTWKHFDDLDLVSTHYDSIKLYLSYVASRVTPATVGNMYYNYGDWVPPPPTPMCSPHLTAAFAYLADLQRASEMARALNKAADATAFDTQFKQIAAGFNTAFFKPAQGYYDTGLQAAQAMALALGIVPEASKQAVVTWLLNDLANHQNHLTTGITGTKYLMEVLHSLGRDDLALQIAENVDYPSWGYMVAHPQEPATTLWELWDSPNEGPGMNSRNHIMFGAVTAWFYKALAGIDHGEGDVNFRNISIAPSIVGDLRSVSASFHTGSGRITSNWQLNGGALLCATAAEGLDVVLDCKSIGSSGVITSVDFANFGTPSGTCGHYSADTKCSATTAAAYVEKACKGKSSCTFTANDVNFGEPCFGTFKRFYAQATCSMPAATSVSMTSSIPVGSVAHISIPLLKLSQVTITESGKTIWSNGTYKSGVAGITGAKLEVNRILINVESGNYDWSVKGQIGERVCATAQETEEVVMSCPDKNQKITHIEFASFGTPRGECGSLQETRCNAGSSRHVVEQACLGKHSCVIHATEDKFGAYSCLGEDARSFASEFYCTSN